MNVFIRGAFATVLLGLASSLAVHAHEHGQELADPGYRPESDLATAFVKGVSGAEIAVFPTIIRTTEKTLYSGASGQWAVEFLVLNRLGTGKVNDTRFELGLLQGTSQWEMFEASMTTLGRQIRDLEIREDYAIVVEILIPPIPSDAMEVFGIHCFVLEPNGNNAFSFLLNSHHKMFNDAGLRSSDTGDSGKEWLASESTMLALMALKAQVDQHPEARAHDPQPGASAERISMIDNFESGLPSGTDSVGLPIGFNTFSNATSTANIAITDAHPPLPNEAGGNQVLELRMNLTGWAGVIHAFGNEAGDRWTPQNWREFLGLRFWLYGNNTGSSVFVDVLDNRKPYSTSDNAERYTYEFRDDFAGWKLVSVPFAKMTRKEVGNQAPNDGLNLLQVHGWAFGNSSSAGELTYFIDDFQLYGGRIDLPDVDLPLESDSRWRNLQTKEGRFPVSVNVRMDPPEGIRPPDNPKLATFTWHYKARLNGMPKNREELEQILAWARRLDALLVAERIAFQFGTRGGARKLRVYFYVNNVERLKALSLQAGVRSLKTRMEFSVADDPEWDEWRKMGRPTEGEIRSLNESVRETAMPVSAMDPILRFNGFSVRRPNDYRWRLLKYNRASHVATFSFPPLSGTHSFNATILLRGIPQDFYMAEEFKAFVDARLREAGPRFEIVSFDSTMTELHGQWAVDYRTLFVDKAPANADHPLFMSVNGVMYLHPLRNRIVIDASYSERGTQAELDGKLDAIGEELINGTIPER